MQAEMHLYLLNETHRVNIYNPSTGKRNRCEKRGWFRATKYKLPAVSAPQPVNIGWSRTNHINTPYSSGIPFFNEP